MGNPVVSIISSLLGGGIKDIISSLKLDPTVKAQLEAAIKEREVELEAKQIELASQTVQVINQTMQAEAKSEHWLQWAWRPFFGLTAAFTIIANYILMPYFQRFGMVPVTIPGDVWNVMLAVLGISALTRGIEKVSDNWPGK